MRVHYVLKRYPRLSETFVVREILGVEAAGVQVGIDALGTPDEPVRHPDVARVTARVRYLGRSGWRRDRALPTLLRLAADNPVTVCRVGWTAWRARRTDPKALARLGQAVLVAERARREGAQLLHAHFATGAAEVAVAAGRLAGIPVTVTAHAKDIFHAENAPLLAGRLAGAAAVVTVSDFNVRHLRQVLSAQTRIAHIPNGVALGPATPGSVGHPDAPVLAVCRLVAKKGVDTLLEAVALLAGAPDGERPQSRALGAPPSGAAAPRARADDTVRVCIIGDGPLREELQAQAQRLGIGERVEFLGARPAGEVEAAYQRCGVVVLPCRVDGNGDRDGLPTVLVEALARAVPVISTSVVGIPELVRHGHTGLLVAPDDPQALAEALRTVRADPALARRLGAAGRELVAAAYDPGASARALTGLWQDLTGTTAEPGTADRRPLAGVGAEHPGRPA